MPESGDNADSTRKLVNICCLLIVVLAFNFSFGPISARYLAFTWFACSPEPSAWTYAVGWILGGFTFILALFTLIAKLAIAVLCL